MISMTVLSSSVHPPELDELELDNADELDELDVSTHSNPELELDPIAEEDDAVRPLTIAIAVAPDPSPVIVTSGTEVYPEPHAVTLMCSIAPSTPAAATDAWSDPLAPERVTGIHVVS